MTPEFFVVNSDEDFVSDEICGCCNEFETYEEAVSVAKKVSKKVKGKFTIMVSMPTSVFENGEEK